MSHPEGTVEPSPIVEREAVALYDEAAQAGVLLRLIGSIAIKVRCPRFRHLMVELGRREALDVDLVGYGRDESAIERLFIDRGYALHPSIRHSREFGIRRLIFLHPSEDLKVDVFLDQLVMAHTIDFTGRLELDSPTVTLVDLLLSKLQIHELTENDLIDTAVLLAEHTLEGDEIDVGHLIEILGDDWGFHHSAVLSLGKLEDALDRWERLPDDAATAVRDRIARLLAAVEAARKSRRWKLRARLGERVRWYEEVGEVDR